MKKLAAMHSFNHRRCSACGELTINPAQRLIGGWFFIRCPNFQRQLRVDPQHGQRWILLTAFVLIGAAALAGAALLHAYLSPLGFLATIVVLAIVGVWAVQVARRSLGLPDHGSIVWDEVVAFLIVLFFVGRDVVSIAVAFGAFRFFDIVKPPPIRQLDRALKKGIGVMADDCSPRATHCYARDRTPTHRIAS